MAERGFFEPPTRARAAEVVGVVERQTSAELVFEVRRSSGRYREADFLCGSALAFAVLCVLLFAEREFRIATFPVHTALAFGLGALLSSKVAPVRRLFLTARAMRFETRRAALGAFHDRGITRTSGRWGVLVMVSTFERRVEVVTDVGLDVAALGTPWKEAVGAIERAVADLDPERFLRASEALGPILGRALPHRDDDRNELPDGLVVDAEAAAPS
jgi:putative membrane protein